MNIDKLINKAKLLRQKTFDAFIEKGEAHLGGSFSMIETSSKVKLILEEVSQ